MLPWSVPLGVEAVLAGVFSAILVYERRSFGFRERLLWGLAWALRAAASLSGCNYLIARLGSAPSVYVLLQAALGAAFLLLVLRLGRQNAHLRHLSGQIEELRCQAANQLDLDPLTGLLNQAALGRWLETQPCPAGCLVVVDLDGFKALNDRFGHLVGDEVLHGVGQLVRASIRHEDKAFRWGGDEFVIFFFHMERELVEARMQVLEERLERFQIRAQGPAPIRFSWGLSTTPLHPLRQSLEEADRRMFESKRVRSSGRPGAPAALSAEMPKSG